MAFLLADRCMETTTTTGTGTLTLAGAVTGYQTLAAVGNGNTCTYGVYEVDANGVPSGAWETGIGTYTAAGTTLSRGVIESSNANALVNFAAGTKRVIVCTVAKYAPLAMATTANRAIQVADQVALSSTSGNARGSGAVDLQIKRTNAANIALGAFSVVGGGLNNKSTGAYSVVCGGYYNACSGNTRNAIVGGRQNTNSAAYGFCGAGRYHTISGDRSGVVCGETNVSSAKGSFCGGGFYNTASGSYSTVPGGRQAVAPLFGQFAHAAGNFASVGDAQHSVFVARKQTTTNAATTLFLNGSSATIDLPNNTTWTVFGLITCRRTDADGTNSHWYFMAGIRRDGTAASTAMTAASTPVLIGQDAGAALTVLTIDADTTAGALRINVTGETAKTYNWTGCIYAMESAG